MSLSEMICCTGLHFWNGIYLSYSSIGLIFLPRGPILQSKGIRAIFQQQQQQQQKKKKPQQQQQTNKQKDVLWKGKIFEHFGKIVQNLKIFWKRGDCVQLLHTINC